MRFIKLAMIIGVLMGMAFAADPVAPIPACQVAYDYTKACDPNTGQYAGWFQSAQYGALVNYWWSLQSYGRYDINRLQWWTQRIQNWDDNFWYLRAAGKKLDDPTIVALGVRPDKPCAVGKTYDGTCIPRRALVTYDSKTFQVNVKEDAGEPIARATPKPPDSGVK
jgi:hypothetical protein